MFRNKTFLFLVDGTLIFDSHDILPFQFNNKTSVMLQIESYWSYEVCHGKHIRQYHEEKETGQVC